MYSPSEDTYFMEDILANYRGKIALEVGIGSGYLTRLLCTNFEFVVGTDIDVNSVMYAKNNTLANIKNKLLVCSDLSLPLKCKFDLIISNPPYLPTRAGGREIAQLNPVVFPVVSKHSRSVSLPSL